jgi:hypothetical protein
MGSPAIFNGKYTKLLTQKGILNSDGSINQNDGIKNYIPYADFEQNVTTGWSLFTTTMTGNNPTGSISAGAASLALTTTGTNPLVGSYSLQVAGGSAWTSGQGFITDAFTIDRGDLSKVLSFSFYYEAVTPGTTNFSGTPGSQSLVIWLYDVTAGAWVQPSTCYGINQGSGPSYVTGTFQSSAVTGQQYRLAILASQSIASAVTFTFDHFMVYPQNMTPAAPPVIDWTSYTPTFSASFGTVTNAKANYRRVGDSLEVSATFNPGTVTASTASFSLPAGLSIDTSKMSGAATNVMIGIGSCAQSTNGGSKDVIVITAPATSTSNVYFTIFDYTSSISALAPANASAVFYSGLNTSITFRIPIVGWSSNVVLSKDATSSRVVGRFSRATSVQAISSTAVTVIQFNNITTDTNLGWDAANYRYYAAVSGDYQYQVNVGFTAVTSAELMTVSIRKNGVVYATAQGRASASGDGRITMADSIPMNANDYVDVVINSSADAAYNVDYVNNTSLAMERISGINQILPSELVAARYTTVSNTLSFTGNTLVQFNTQTFDAFGSVLTGSNWRFVAPTAGLYSVTCQIIGTGYSAQAGANEWFAIDLYYGPSGSTSSFYSRLGYSVQNTSQNEGIAQGTDSIYLSAGDFIQVYFSQNIYTSGNLQLSGTSGYNFIDVFKIK